MGNEVCPKKILPDQRSLVHNLFKHTCPVANYDIKGHNSKLFTFFPLQNLQTMILPKLSLMHSSLRELPQRDGHSRRASNFPYPNISSLLVQATLFHQCLFHSWTPLPYLSIFHVANLSYSDALSLTYTFSTNSLLFILSMKIDQYRVFLFTNHTTPHLTPLPLMPHATPLKHILIALAIPSCQSTCSS